ncbi:MAG: DUF4276 family protein [Candidatus Pelethousia sp.]|nr:DUF4276 family protein [Candidatus Pelethousia sp.]
MKNVYIYCEGQAEENFINELLTPYFLAFDIYVRPIVCTTKRTSTEKQRGGVSDYGKIKKELTILCKQHRNEYVTTMFDYYGMPDNTPGIDNATSDIYERMAQIEASIDQDVAIDNCFFSLMLHEFEALLFSDPSAFIEVAPQETVEAIASIRAEFQTPEHINNDVRTSPSKRLEALIPRYAKVVNGVLVGRAVGLDCMMRECSHFARWIEKIKACGVS